jgi:hypothetical protein
MRFYLKRQDMFSIERHAGNKEASVLSAPGYVGTGLDLIGGRRIALTVLLI